jgi:acyl transferase domain-containing protein
VVAVRANKVAADRPDAERAPRHGACEVRSARPCELLVIAGETQAQLDREAARLRDLLVDGQDRPLALLARDLQLDPRPGRYRRAFVAHDAGEALRELDEDRPRAESFVPDRPLAFLFPGVADQRVGMARGLYECEPVFRHAFDRCAELMRPEIGVDLGDVLYPEEEPTGTNMSIDLAALLGRRRASAPIERTVVAQPLVFCVEYAIARLLGAWGITPSVMAGYSIGEYTAAALADVLSADDAAVLVARRADFIDMVPSGAMLVVPLSEHAIRPLLGEGLSLAAVNGPELSVVAGHRDDVARCERRLAADHIVGMRVNTTHAFHSEMMAPIEPWLRGLVGTYQLHRPTTPYLSNLTGTWISEDEATDPQYWARHLSGTVRFHDSLAELWLLDDIAMVEVGAGRMLGSLAADLSKRPQDDPPPIFATIPEPGSGNDVARLLETVGRLWEIGVPVDWTGMWRG